MRVFLGALLAALLGSLAALPPSPALAARIDGVSLIGSGYGHGKGMSQYGAKAAAERGRTQRQILDFYYPGTGVGTAGGAIKVLITSDTTTSVVVVHRSHLTLRSLASGRTWKLDRSNARRWRITPAAGNTRSRLWVRVGGGSWRVVRDVPGQAQFNAGGRPVRLVVPGGSRVYRGALRSAVPSSGQGRDTVNVLPLEGYLRGVVPREMPALWHAQAVQAQTVAARTYAAFERADAARGHFHVWDTTLSQVYGGVDSEEPASDAAIRATRGEIRTYGGAPAFTQFGSSNGGWSVAGSRPYLVAQRDDYDPATRWSVKVSDEAIERAWPHIGQLTGVEVLRRDGRGSWGGRVLELRLTGTQGVATPSGDSFRSILGLRSTLFTLA